MNHWFDFIVFHMRAQPEKPALVMENRVVTYGMLKTGMERCARRIAGLNLVRQDPVTVLYADPIRHLTLCLALYRIGIPSLSLEYAHIRVKLPKIGTVIVDAEAKKLGFPGERLIEATDEWFAADLPNGSAFSDGFASRHQVCRIHLTSGSTGEPKLVALTIENIGRRLQMFFSTRWNVALNLPGFSTSLGFIPICGVLTAGQTLCFAQSSFQALRMIDLFAVDFLNAATEQLVALTRVARKSNAHLKTLRTVHVSGSMATRALLEAAVIHVCHNILCRYGNTEMGNLARTNAQEVIDRPNLVGHIEPGVEIGIFDENGKRCPDDNPGYVRARYDEPGADWRDTGDIGWLAPENRLFIAGRSADGAAGRDISPMHEIEHLLRLEWDAADAGAALMQGGERPEIWLGTVDCKDADAEKLETIARARGIDCTLKLFALPAIPRTVNGKINRSQLKVALQAAAGKA
jgi:acyl-coenzyme A synthetase/AMP-(fatty) acid ligase